MRDVIFIFNVQNRMVIKHEKQRKTIIKLSEYECMLLEVLSNNELNKWDDICEYMYKHYADRDTRVKIYNFKDKIMDKTGMYIKTLFKIRS